MTEFAIYLSGDHGTLLVDGKPTPLFGALVACDIKRLAPPLEYSGQSSNPANIIRDHPVAEVTLRLPLDTGDHLTLMRDGLPRDIDGPTGDTVATEANDALRAKVKDWLEDADTWDEWPQVESAILGVLDATAIADEVDANDWRSGRRESKAARAAADAEWATLQIATIVDLQEQLDAYMMLIGRLVMQPPRPGLFGKQPPLPDYSPYGRAAMLCSRLEDAELTADVRQWLKDMNSRLVEDPPLTAETLLDYTHRRIALQDRLGDAIKKYHGR